MKVLIVEDEALLAKQLKALVSVVATEAEIIGHTHSVAATVQWLNENAAPDLILMDIELADGQSFQIFSAIQVKAPVIFTTAYDEYALQAFKVNSIDYLLKPIKEEELKAALDKFKTLQKENVIKQQASLEELLHQFQEKGKNKNRFLVKQGQKMLSVSTEDIAYFSAKNTLNFITTKKQQKFIVDHSLDEIEMSINSKTFFRINRQFILSHDVITAIHPWFNGKLKIDITLPVDGELVISREKAPLFKEWMGA